MTDERGDGIRVEAIEVPVDYDKTFAEQLQVLQQMIYEFRHNRGVANEGQEGVGVFATHSEKDSMAFTARSSHAGHIIIEYPGRSVLIDFANPEETLKITADGHQESIDANAAGITILADIQRRLAKLELSALDV